MTASKEIKAPTAAERQALEEERHHGNVLGLKTFMALLFGTSVGYFLYSEYFFVYEATKNAQTYTNVSPNMPGGGAALADAGRVTFSRETCIAWPLCSTWPRRRTSSSGPPARAVYPRSRP